jgi:hypothetical protein
MISNCPYCDTKCNVPDALVGRKVRCQICGQTFAVSANASTPPPIPPSALAPVKVAVPIAVPVAKAPIAIPVPPIVPSPVEAQIPVESTNDNWLDLQTDQPPDPASLILLFNLASLRRDPAIRNWAFHQDGDFARVYRDGKSIDWFPHREANRRFVVPAGNQPSCVEYTSTEGKRYRFHPDPAAIPLIRRYLDDAGAYDIPADSIDIQKLRNSGNRNVVFGLVLVFVGILIVFAVESIIEPVDRVRLRRLGFVAMAGAIMFATGVGQLMRVNKEERKAAKAARHDT